MLQPALPVLQSLDTSGSGYYYNAKQRYYYDTKAQMYYGGDPPVWTEAPKIPAEALYTATQVPDAGAKAGQGPSSSAHTGEAEATASAD